MHSIRFFTAVAGGLFVFAFFFLGSCGQPQAALPQKEGADAEKPRMKYAKYFSFSEESGCRVVRVTSPGEAYGGINRGYMLVPRTQAVPDHSPDLVVVRTPLEKVTCETGFQVSLLELLGCFDAISGVSGKTRVGQDTVHTMIDSGDMPVTGFMRKMDMEILLRIAPDMAFVNVSSVSSDVFEHMRAYGIQPGFFCASLEEHPLGALEWIRFMGAFFEKDSLAEAVFREREEVYIELQRKIADVGFMPTVIAGYSRKGAWSTMGSSRWFTTMLRHSGASYLLEGNELERGHLLSHEVAMEAGMAADFWVNTHYRAGSLDELLGIDERYILFRSVRHQGVYNNNKSCFLNGRNRFWDVGMSEPHVLLADLAAIFHPEVFADHSLTYYQRLKNEWKDGEVR